MSPDPAQPGRPPVRLAVLNAGTGEPSPTRLLAERTAQKAMDLIRASGGTATACTLELGPLAKDIATAMVSGLPSERLPTAFTRLAEADAVIAATPVYKAGISGLFKSFADVLDDDVLLAKPVVLAATADTARHAMVVDDHLRPLFACLRALPVPTSLFAAPEDWSDPALGKRVERAATELVHLLGSGVGPAMAEEAWAAPGHTFAGGPGHAARVLADADFPANLRRLAAARARRGAYGTRRAGGTRVPTIGTRRAAG